MKKTSGWMKRWIYMMMAFVFAFTCIVPEIKTYAEDVSDGNTGYQEIEVIEITDIEDADTVPDDMPEATETDAEEEFEVNLFSVGDAASYISTKNFDIYGNTYIRSYLNSDEQVFYDKIKAACDKLLKTTDNAVKKTYTINGVESSAYVINSDGTEYTNLTRERAIEIANVFAYQNPQYYFFKPKILSNSSKVYFTCYDSFYDGQTRAVITQYMFTVLDDWVSEIKSQTSLYDKEKKADKIICDNTIYLDDVSTPYSEFASTGELNYSQSAYSMIVLGRTVCAGYTKTFEMLMNAADVLTIGVTSDEHAWNKINLNGIWYNVDTTWNDQNAGGVSGGGTTNEKYLNMTDSEITYGNKLHYQQSYYDDLAPICDTVFSEDLLSVQVVPVQSVSLTPAADISLYIHNNKTTENVSVTVNPDNATDKNYHIYIADEDVALYYNNKVYAVAAGKTELVVKTVDGGKTVTRNVEVYDKFEKPSAPTVSSKTSDSITLNTITGCEYSIDKIKWQSSTTFSGLNPNTSYTFYARKAASGYYVASDVSSGTTATTNKLITTNATVKANGIYVTSTSPKIVAGCVTEKTDSKAVLEYRWLACNENNPSKWFEISPWTKNNEWLSWQPDTYGNYILVCYVRVVGNEDASLVQTATGVEAHPYIKGKCQMPFTGVGGGYLIGVESYNNPSQAYKYEMLILDCTLLAEGKPAWVYTTGKHNVSEGSAFWTIWQPQYGYYWTLFRVYDKNGNLIDEECYGFANVY